MEIIACLPLNSRVSCIEQELSKYLLEQLIGFNCKSEWAQSEKLALHSPMRDFPENCLLLIRNTEYYLSKKRKARNYQDKYIFENDLKGSLKVRLRDIWVILWLYHKFTVWSCEIPLLRTMPQLLLLESSGSVKDKMKDAYLSGGWRRKKMNGYIASPTQWTWIWANSRRQQRMRKPGMLQSTG